MSTNKKSSGKRHSTLFTSEVVWNEPMIFCLYSSFIHHFSMLNKCWGGSGDAVFCTSHTPPPNYERTIFGPNPRLSFSPQPGSLTEGSASTPSLVVNTAHDPRAGREFLARSRAVDRMALARGEVPDGHGTFPSLGLVRPVRDRLRPGRSND